MSEPNLFAQWFNDRKGDLVSIGLTNGFAVTGISEGLNADGSAVFLSLRSGKTRLYSLAHIITVGEEEDW